MLVRHRAAVGLAGAALFVGSVYAVVTSDAFVRRMVRSVTGRTFRGPSRVESAAFTFRDGLVVRGLVVRDPLDPAGEPALRVETLRADFGLFVLGEGPRVTSVTLERPSLRLTRRADGTLSAASLLRPVPSGGRPAARPPAVVVVDGTFAYDDPSLLAGGPVTVTDVAARLEPTGDAWRCEVRGRAAELGAVEGIAFLAPDGGVTASVDVPALPLDPRVLRRLRAPVAARAAEMGGGGSVRLRAQVAYGPGRPTLVGGAIDLAGVSTAVRLSDPSAPDGAAQAIDVVVAGGRAELSGGTAVLTGLDVRVLGASVRCDRATVSGLDGEGAPSVDGDVRIEGLAVGDGIRPHLPRTVLRVLDAYGLGGRVDATVAVRGAASAPRLDVEGTLSGGRARFDGYVRPDGTRTGFPWDVGGVEARFSFATETSTLRFGADGRHGPAKVRLDGVVDFGAGEELPDVTIAAEDVPFDADLRAAFRDRAERTFDRWGPSGTAARIDVRIARDPHADGPHGDAAEISIHLDGRASMRPRLLPTELSDLRGRIDVLYPSRGDHRGERVRIADVRAKGDGFTLRVDGRVDTERSVGSDDLTVTAETTDVGGALGRALLASGEFVPDGVKRLLTDMEPRGPLRIDAAIAGDPDRRRDRVVVSLLGAAVRGYRDVPFAADSLTGTVTVEGDEARIDGLEGRALGVPVRGAGRLLGISRGPVETDVVVEATDLPLGASLRAALGPIAAKAAPFWDRMGPVGGAGTLGTRADAVLALRPSSDAVPVEIRLRRIRGPLRPAGIEFDCRDGEFHWDGREATLRADAAIGAADVEIDRARYDLRTGRLDVLADARGLRFPEDVESLFSQETAAALSAAFPERDVHAQRMKLVYDPGPERLDVSGEIEIRDRTPAGERGPGLEPDGAFLVDRLTFWFPPGLPVAFDGSLRAEGLRLRAGIDVEDFAGTLAFAGRIDDEGTDVGVATEGASLVAAGLPLREARIEAQTTSRGPKVEATADLHGGRLSARVGPKGQRAFYAGDVHLRGADLSRFAPGSGLSGVVDGDCTFRNPLGRDDTLEGSVEITVRDGDLVRFPVISAILNLIPGAGNLTDGILSGSIEGRRMKVRDLVVRGPLLSLTNGRGTVGFDGALDLSVSPTIPPLSAVFVTGTVKKPEASLRFLSGGK